MKMTLRNMCQDEISVCYFDPEAKKQNMQWKHPGLLPPKKFKSFFSKEVDFYYLLG